MGAGFTGRADETRHTRRQEVPLVDLLIADVDHTLYDWATPWARAFAGIIDAIARELKISREAALDAARTVHRQSESMEPLDLLQRVCRNGGTGALPGREFLVAARERWLTDWSAGLRLHQGVEPTLRELRAAGCTIVFLTESRRTATLWRLERLGVLEFADRIYTAEDPQDPIDADLALFPPTGLPPPRVCRALPPDLHKGDPVVVSFIANESGTPPSRTLVVGDHLEKDVRMARHAGAHAAWARYGTVRDADVHALVERVCHWPTSDGTTNAAAPDVEDEGVAVLDRFDEMLARLRFGRRARCSGLTL